MSHIEQALREAEEAGLLSAQLVSGIIVECVVSGRKPSEICGDYAPRSIAEVVNPPTRTLTDFLRERRA